VLWLDALEHKYVEEVGAMNIFFVIDGKLATPKLTGSILQGITRKSILQISRDLGIESEERSITIDEVVDGIRSKRLTECFGAGTAAVVSPVGKIGYKDEVHVISEKAGPWSGKLFDALTGIQYGKMPDNHGWVYRVM
jgi:branched-chain amino acid aminotransferase